MPWRICRNEFAERMFALIVRHNMEIFNWSMRYGAQWVCRWSAPITLASRFWAPNIPTVPVVATILDQYNLMSHLATRKLNIFQRGYSMQLVQVLQGHNYEFTNEELEKTVGVWFVYDGVYSFFYDGVWPSSHFPPCETKDTLLNSTQKTTGGNRKTRERWFFP